MKPEICSACRGTGEIREDVGTHYSEYEYYTCRKCRGTGKILIGTVEYTVPFNADMNEVGVIQSEMFKVMEKFKDVKVTK